MLKVFYRKKCNMYFDVKESYLAQIRISGINPECVVVTCKDEKGNNINFGDNKKLNEHSKLNLLG